MKPRLRALCMVTLGLYLSFTLLLVTQVKNGLDPAGSPVGYDFSAYYEAAVFAKRGAAAEAYDDARMVEAEHQRFPGSKARLPWNYPPSFQLLLLPLSYLPYACAFALFTLGLGAGYIVVLRRFGVGTNFIPMALFPGAIINLFLGANGLLIALLIGAGFLVVHKRPYLGGFFLGLVSIKPHLALIIPFALLFGRNIKALIAMALTAAALAGFSALAFGADAWLAFAGKLTNAADVARQSSSDWRRVPTLYTFFLSLGLPRSAAQILHGLIALSALILSGFAWRKSPDMLGRAAILALCTLIVTPYARIYDFALLVFPLLWLNRQTDLAQDGWKQALLALAWVAPLAGLLLGTIMPLLGLLTAAGLGALALWAIEPAQEGAQAP